MLNHVVDKVGKDICITEGKNVGRVDESGQVHQFQRHLDAGKKPLETAGHLSWDRADHLGQVLMDGESFVPWQRDWVVFDTFLSQSLHFHGSLDAVSVDDFVNSFIDGSIKCFQAVDILEPIEDRHKLLHTIKRGYITGAV